MTTGIRLGRHVAVGDRRRSSRSPQPIQPSRAFCSLATHKSIVPARAMQFNSISAVRRRRRLNSGAQQTIEFCPGYARYFLDSYYDTLLLLSSPHLYPLQPYRTPSLVAGSPGRQLQWSRNKTGFGVWPQSRRKSRKLPPEIGDNSRIRGKSDAGCLARVSTLGTHRGRITSPSTL